MITLKLDHRVSDTSGRKILSTRSSVQRLGEILFFAICVCPVQIQVQVVFSLA